MLDPTRRNIIIVGAAAAVLVVGVMTTVIIRGRAGLEEAPANGTAVTQGSTPDQPSRPAAVTGEPATTGGNGTEGEVIAPPGAPKGSSYKIEGKTEDTIDPKVIGTVQTFTPDELKAMGLPTDAIVRYKWVLPPKDADYSAPMRIILDLPEDKPQQDVVMPVKQAK
jgi:hypothetical protein